MVSIDRKKVIAKKILKDRDVLERLYHCLKLSLNDISIILEIPEPTICRTFKRLGIPTRPLSEAVSLAKTKNKTKDNKLYGSRNDVKLAVELNALIHTDFTVCSCRRKLKIQGSTTHMGQIAFFNNIMKEHSVQPVKCIPKKCNETTLRKLDKKQWYEWQVYAFVDESFAKAITLDKLNYLRELSKKDEDLQLLYITRAIECDGGIILKKHKQIIKGRIFLTSTDQQYLHAFGDLLNKSFGLDVHYTSDRLWIPVIDNAFDFLRKMPLRHPEKLWKRELTIEYARTVATPEKVEKLEEIKTIIKKLRDIAIEIAEERLMLPKGSRAIEATELIRLVLERFCQSYKTNPPPFLQ